jgi:NUMOD4 motif/HNH endonuclease
MKKEIWKPIKEYECLYAISSHGRIKNIRTNKFLSPIRIKDNQTVLRLRKDGKYNSLYVSRLIANHFLPNPELAIYVKHLDKDNTNNKLENLEWIPRKVKTYSIQIPDLPGEEWRDVVGFEGLYVISNLGRVKSLKRKYLKMKNPFLTPSIQKVANKSSYYKVYLYKEGQEFKVFLHRLIGMAFIPNLENKPFINHIDGNGLNNAIDNIEWCTAKENNTHAREILKRKMGHDPRPVKSRDCFGKIQKYSSICGAAKKLNVRARSISKVLAGERKTTGGYEFKYCS